MTFKVPPISILWTLMSYFGGDIWSTGQGWWSHLLLGKIPIFPVRWIYPTSCLLTRSNFQIVTAVQGLLRKCKTLLAGRTLTTKIVKWQRRLNTEFADRPWLHRLEIWKLSHQTQLSRFRENTLLLASKNVLFFSIGNGKYFCININQISRVKLICSSMSR